MNKSLCVLWISILANVGQASDVNEKLLDQISKYNLLVFYSHEEKRNDDKYPVNKNPQHRALINDKKISQVLGAIKTLLETNADPNFKQLLHEAIFLYFIFKGLEYSAFDYHKYHDNSESNNELKLIELLLNFDAKLCRYRHPAHLGLYELVSLRCFK